MTRDLIMQRILIERQRQLDLPGREFDMRNGVNDWVAIVGRYLFEETRRGVVKPNRTNFEDSLVKAAAVLLAALEHCPEMDAQNQFANDFSLDSTTADG
jgi:hypothetical protein